MPPRHRPFDNPAGSASGVEFGCVRFALRGIGSHGVDSLLRYRLATGTSHPDRERAQLVWSRPRLCENVVP